MVKPYRDKWESIMYDDDEHCFISNYGGLWSASKCPYCNIIIVKNVMIMGNELKYGMKFCPNCGKSMVYKEGENND